MEYDFSKAISSIHNIVCSFNKGGTFTVTQLVEDLWAEAPEWKQNEKITKPSNTDLHTVTYAKRQVRQEVRRSLYNYFNDIEDRHYEIYRATPLGANETFWVAEVQYSVSEIVEEEPDSIDVLVETVTRVLPPGASLDKLLKKAAANNPCFFVSEEQLNG